MANGDNGKEFDSIPIVTPETVQAMGMGNSMGDIIARGGTIEQIRSKYHTAIRVQVPRDLDSVKKRCLQEAKHGGDEFGWGWPVEVPVKDESGQIVKDANGKWVMKEEIISGKSVHLAMAAARNWGNCTTELYVTSDLPDRYELLGVFVDFETGYTNMRPYTIRKASRDLSDKQKKKASQIARQDDMTLQIGLSKCIRNVILGALPSWLTDPMYDESLKYGKKRIEENLAESIEKAVFTYGKYGVTLAQLEGFLENPSDKWNADDIIKLRGVLQSIKDQEIKISEIFPPVTTTAPQEEPKPQPAPKSASAPATPAPTSAKTEPKELNDAQGDMLQEIADILNTIAGTDPRKRSFFMRQWTDNTCGMFTDLKNHPELFDTALDRARISLEEAKSAS